MKFERFLFIQFLRFFQHQKAKREVTVAMAVIEAKRLLVAESPSDLPSFL